MAPLPPFHGMTLGYAISVPEFKENEIRNFRATILFTLNCMDAIEKVQKFETEPSAQVFATAARTI
jgi:hypothetical protein